MPTFHNDSDVKELNPQSHLGDLVKLLSLLCGAAISVPSKDELHESSSQDRARAEILAGLYATPGQAALTVTFEQLNELLLLLGQDRISKFFFDFFFLDADPPFEPAPKPAVGSEDEQAPPGQVSRSITWEQLKTGVTRFRGYALLCFGNFRFAFKRLNEAQTSVDFLRELGEWTDRPSFLGPRYKNRSKPIVSITTGGSEIPRDQTWQLGYISRGSLYKDAAKVLLVRAKQLGESLEDGLAKIDVRKDPEIAKAFKDYWERLPESFAVEWATSLPQLEARVRQLMEEFEGAVNNGTQNTVKYLTWDLLDVYVATSMRDPWNFTDAYDSIKRISQEPAGNLGELQLRWFDPTQSYEGSVIDKGLVEGLMLKRARLTIYMVQEGETLGKDSELAATLAQGKPVIAYVPQHATPEQLAQLVEDLKSRPVEFFRKRLRALDASGFFDRHDNISKVIQRLERIGDPVTDSAELLKRVEAGKKLADEFAPAFDLVSTESADFLRDHREDFDSMSRLMAAVEAVEADNRTETLQSKHPLAFQVDLDTGVANGVLVARSPIQCAGLVRGFLLNELIFNITPLMDPGNQTHRLATVLQEKTTGSRFRVVTTNDVLTNSFWNFYGIDSR